MKGAKIGIYSVIKQSCLSIALLSSLYLPHRTWLPS